ncbi:MAG: Rne/Rng family ribonuclease [Gammaproteobacteria bacterium]
MSEEILINVTPHETRVAVVENGVLQDVYVERTRKRGLVGNIYKGKVSRVLPGMQAAFIEIGLERAGFLHVADIEQTVEALEIEQEVKPDKQIDKLLSEGQEILVQVMKDPLGTKGARLTTRLSVASRYLVYLPDDDLVGISQRIETEAERERLRDAIAEYQAELLQQQMPRAVNDGKVVLHKLMQDVNDAGTSKAGGFIVRTAAEGVSREAIHKDMDFLYKIWQSNTVRAQGVNAPGLVFEDLPLAIRAMRDLLHDEIEKVKIDSRETYKRLLEFSKQFVPEFLARIEYYPGERPILDLYSVEDELQKSLSRKVQLKSGGYLVIDQTEAMSTIDVNTGAFVGHRNLEETIYKTNLEAAQAIARQLRLRNLGGIIIIDFIDMQEPEHARQVLRALTKHTEKDHSKITISELTSLGLVQLTRKRTRESLEHILCETCPSCHGRGSIKTPETICYEIFREILREVRQFEANKLLVVAPQKIVDMLMDEESSSVADLEEFIGKPITFQVEPVYSHEQYDIVLL